MKTSGWIPLDKNLVKSLPRNRSFTELEAMFSLSLDFDNGNDATISGYARRWGWNRKKVKSFLDRSGVVIKYPLNTKSIQNQRGQIKGQIWDRYGTDMGQIKFIDLSRLKEEKDRHGTDKGQIWDRSGATTLNPKNPNPNPNPNLPPNPPSGKSSNDSQPGERSGGVGNSKVQEAFSSCKKLLGMSDEEIQEVYSICSEPKKFAEAVKFAIEKNNEQILDNPLGFIKWAYRKGKMSKETRRKTRGEKKEQSKYKNMDPKTLIIGGPRSFNR